MSRTLLALALLGSSLSAQAQTLAAPDQLALAELIALAKEHPNPKALVDVAGGQPVALVQGQATVGFIGRLTVDESDWRDWAEERPEVRAGACRSGIASFRVDAQHLEALSDLPMDLIELASRAIPDVNKAKYGTRVDSVHAGFNLPQPFHGEGVLIGVLDWGFDYTHPMFYDTTLTTSRIRAVWDQYRQAGPPPSGFDYGLAADAPWDIQDLGSDTSNVYSYSTHGTHVAGIAAGGGAGIGLTGMAPAAQLLFATLMVDEAAALDAFEWMHNVAEEDGKRLVINNSWGLPQWGTPDGTSLSNQFIDNLSEEGVVFVSSNGNNGDSDFHIEHTFEGPNDVMQSRVQFYPLANHPSAWGQNLTLWGQPGESFSAGFMLTQGMNTWAGESPMYHTSDGPFVLDTMLVVNEDTIVYDVAVEPPILPTAGPSCKCASTRQLLPRRGVASHLHKWPCPCMEPHPLVQRRRQLGAGLRGGGATRVAGRRPILRHSTTRMRRVCHCHWRLQLRVLEHQWQRIRWQPGQFLLLWPHA